MCVCVCAPFIIWKYAIFVQANNIFFVDHFFLFLLFIHLFACHLFLAASFSFTHKLFFFLFWWFAFWIRSFNKFFKWTKQKKPSIKSHLIFMTIFVVFVCDITHMHTRTHNKCDVSYVCVFNILCVEYVRTNPTEILNDMKQIDDDFVLNFKIEIQLFSSSFVFVESVCVCLTSSIWNTIYICIPLRFVIVIIKCTVYKQTQRE